MVKRTNIIDNSTSLKPVSLQCAVKKVITLVLYELDMLRNGIVLHAYKMEM